MKWGFVSFFSDKEDGRRSRKIYLFNFSSNAWLSGFIQILKDVKPIKIKTSIAGIEISKIIIQAYLAHLVSSVLPGQDKLDLGFLSSFYFPSCSTEYLIEECWSTKTILKCLLLSEGTDRSTIKYKPANRYTMNHGKQEYKYLSWNVSDTLCISSVYQR